jgi:hypothetical protein
LGDAADSTSKTYQQSKDAISNIFGIDKWGQVDGAKQAAKDFITTGVETLGQSKPVGGAALSSSDAADLSSRFSNKIGSAPKPNPTGTTPSLLNSMNPMNHSISSVYGVYGALTDPGSITDKAKSFAGNYLEGIGIGAAKNFSSKYMGSPIVQSGLKGVTNATSNVLKPFAPTYGALATEKASTKMDSSWDALPDAD